MATYNIKLVQEDLLKVGFGPPADGDQIVKDAVARLDEMIATGELSGGTLLKIDGPQSVPVAYTIAHKVAHLYKAIAIFDPKMGKKGFKTFIVAITHTPAYKLGEAIETEEPQMESKIKVVLCGPPQSGKSCLREGLKQAISSIKGAPYPYIITACPDGEGAWFSEAAKRDPDLARRLKEDYKAKFTPDFAKTAANWVRNANTPINIIDVGGKITDENRVIMREATHAAILAGDDTKIPEWENFCQSLDLKVIAKIHSKNQPDCIDTESPLLTGIIQRMERGEDVSTRPMVKALAKLLLDLT